MRRCILPPRMHIRAEVPMHHLTPSSCAGVAPRATLVRGLVAALAVVLLTLALQPAKADAAPREFYGVVPEGLDLGEADFDRLQRGGVGVVRLPLFWSNVETADDRFNWSRYDRLIGALARHNIRVLPFLYGTPRWLSNDTRKPPRTARARQEMQEFLTTAVDRYGRDGLLWKYSPGLAKPVTTWQFLNEVNAGKFYAPRPNPKEYGKLLKLADRAITAGDSRAKVILGGMYGTPSSGQKAWIYLQKLYRVRGVKRAFDGVALHPYAGNKRGIRKQVSKVRQVMKRKGDKRTKTYVTEIGWGSAKGRSPQKKGRQGQARLVKVAANLLRKTRKFKVKQILYYAFKDPGPGYSDPCSWCPTAGLLTRNLGMKPAWRKFAQLTGGKP